jgi:hypothetical protein
MQMMLNVMQDLLNGTNAIAVSTVHMQISPAQLSKMMRLHLRHLLTLPQHSSACACIPG